MYIHMSIIGKTKREGGPMPVALDSDLLNEGLDRRKGRCLWFMERRLGQVRSTRDGAGHDD